MLLTEYRLDLVIQALRNALKMEHPADAVLRHFFQAERIGSNERSLVAETLFGVLRHRLLLEYGCTLDAKGRPRHAAWPWPTGSGSAATTCANWNPCSRRKKRNGWARSKRIVVDELPLSIQAELPEWIVDKLRTQHSDAEILELGRSMQQPAPLDLRVNTLLAGRDEVLQALQADGLDAQATPYSPMGIRLKYKPALNKHALFLTGKFEVQDEGSQMLGLLLAPKRNDMVVDFCAGAGGKTLMLGAMMNSQGRLYAWDVSEKRLTNLKPRLKRSGLSNVQPQLIAHENDSKVKRLAGKIDRVLVDAPCSGLGTLRRNPDLKFRQSPQSVAELNVKQAAILDSAARLLKQGGRLVYATCSLLHEENQGIVQAFLATHPDFALLPAGEVLRQQHIDLRDGRLSATQPATAQYRRLLRGRAGTQRCIKYCSPPSAC